MVLDQFHLEILQFQGTILENKIFIMKQIIQVFIMD